MIPSINALDIESIASEKCRNRHSAAASVPINTSFSGLIRIQDFYSDFGPLSA